MHTGRSRWRRLAGLGVAGVLAAAPGAAGQCWQYYRDTKSADSSCWIAVSVNSPSSAATSCAVTTKAALGSGVVYLGVITDPDYCCIGGLEPTESDGDGWTVSGSLVSGVPLLETGYAGTSGGAASAQTQVSYGAWGMSALFEASASITEGSHSRPGCDGRCKTRYTDAGVGSESTNTVTLSLSPLATMASTVSIDLEGWINGWHSQNNTWRHAQGWWCDDISCVGTIAPQSLSQTFTLTVKA